MWTFRSEATPPHWIRRDLPGVAALAFSTRLGGRSAPPYDALNLGRSTADDPANVEWNRGHLLVSLGLDVARLATAGQVHGAEVTEVREPGLHRETDALVTRVPGIPLAV